MAPEEWRLLARTPVEAMFGVVVVSFGGIRRELRTIERTLRTADGFPAETELVTELAGFVSVNARRLQREAGRMDLRRPVLLARVFDDSRASVTVLRRVATEDERVDYGAFVLYCVERTAEAGAEGGLFGIGGRRFSPAEHRFLDSLAETLDVERRPTGPSNAD